jgi:phosphoglycolate phosphatase (TIGR01487 family)
VLVLSLKRVRAVISDVDGTLTRRRGDLLLSVEAIEAARMLESNGIKVLLATGNSVPVAAGLARYIGTTGPVIAENGCTIFDSATWEIIHVCNGKPPQSLAEELKALGLRPSWQNPYRYHDIAFLDPRRDPSLRHKVEEVVSKYGDYIAIVTGYAYHIAPKGASKGRGAEVALKLIGVKKDEAIAVGDGENDIPLFEAVGFSAAPSDADPVARERANYVASKPGGKGFAEIARMIVEGRIP